MSDAPGRDVIFDEAVYLGPDAEELAALELSGREGVGVDEIRRRHTEHELFQEAVLMRTRDLEGELCALSQFFDGAKGERFEFTNPYGGNMLLVRGSAAVFCGISAGIIAYPDFRHAAGKSRSHLRAGEVFCSAFSDCEISKIWEQEGSLFVSGATLGGHVTAEVRQLTDAGQAVVDAALVATSSEWEDCCLLEVSPWDGSEALGRRYLPGQEGKLLANLWDEPGMCPPAGYLEKCYGCHAPTFVAEVGLGADAPSKDMEKAK